MNNDQSVDDFSLYPIGSDQRYLIEHEPLSRRNHSSDFTRDSCFLASENPEEKNRSCLFLESDISQQLILFASTIAIGSG